MAENNDDDDIPVEVYQRLPNSDIAESHPRRSALLHVEKITKQNLVEMLENAEALIEFQNKATKLIIKRTKNEDWLMIGKNPYPMESAVKKALQTIGASISNLRIEEEIITERHNGSDFKVKYFTAYGDMIFNGRTAQAIGTSSSKDKFFAERTRKNGDSSVKYLLTLDEVDLPSVKKKAVTNLYKRGLDLIMKLNPTEAELKELGITPISGFSFAQGTQGGSVDTPEIKELRTKLSTLLATASKELNRPISAILKESTAFNDFGGYLSVDRVSANMLPKAIMKITEMIKGGVK